MSVRNGTTDPHLITGYNGHNPEEKLRCSETYGSPVTKLLLDPTINRTEQLMLSHRTTDEFAVERDDRRLDGRSADPIYFDPMIPGYEGFMPNLNAKNGQRYRVLAREGLQEFQLQEERNRASLNNLVRKIELQAGKWVARSIKDRLLLESSLKFPVPVIRPDCAAATYGGNRVTVKEQYENPRDHSPPPYFLNINQSGTYPMSGYTGHVPSNLPGAGSALANFTTNYRLRRSVEWAPVSITSPDPPSILLQPTEIYNQHIGLMPNYLGHVPGAAFSGHEGCQTMRTWESFVKYSFPMKSLMYHPL